LEKRLLNDGELFEELLISEDELVDEYVGGRLTREERHQFESHFLVTADRHRKFQFGRTLNEYLGNNDVADSVTPADAGRQNMFRNRFLLWPVRRPLIAFSLVAILCLGVAICWGLLRRNAVLSGPPLIVALAPGGTRSQGAGLQRVQIPSGAIAVEFRLPVTQFNYREHIAELRSGTGKLSEFSSTRTYEDHGKKVVVLLVEADKLPPDDYQLKLLGINPAGERELIDSYPFRVSNR
jgi:hypothetical protein